MNITEVPNWENMKSFMVFEGIPSEDTFLFDGNFEHFADTFFANPEWEAVEAWADENEYMLVIEGTPTYVEMSNLFANEDLSIVDDEFYDADGSIHPDGMFDAAGHLVDAEQYYERAEFERDRKREEE